MPSAACRWLFPTGIIYSFSVFFKPIAAEFNWDRATVASIYSLAMIFRGAVTVPIGWLADRYGPGKMFGLLRRHAPRRSHSDQPGDGTLAVLLDLRRCYRHRFVRGVCHRQRRHFPLVPEKNRGMALGIVAAGSGFGTLLLVPVSQHLINVFAWSSAYAVIGTVAGVITIASAFFLKAAPAQEAFSHKEARKPYAPSKSVPDLRKMILSREMLLIIAIFAMVNFCIQMVMVHLVNFATDIGISSLQAASYLGIIGVVSIAGRLIMGSMADRIGNLSLPCNLRHIASGITHRPFFQYLPCRLFCIRRTLRVCLRRRGTATADAYCRNLRNPRHGIVDGCRYFYKHVRSSPRTMGRRKRL